jgi:predicted NBD/HSP70 family sugar kinase
LLDLVTRQATAGDERTLRALSEIGIWLGKGLGNLVNLFNPELIVLGGFFHLLAPYLEPGASESVQAVALAAPRALVKIEPSALGPDAVLIGAAELALSGVIADPAGVERMVRSVAG